MKKLFKIGEKQHGRGDVLFSWHPDGSFIASAGSNGLVHIYDRNGEQIEELGLNGSGRVLALEWSANGDILAILQKGNAVMPLWSVSSRSITNLDTNVQDPTFIKWSKSGLQLAIGTGKGNLQMYSHISRKKTPYLGKHPKTIVHGDWSNDDKLALASSDGTVTLSSADGTTMQQIDVKGQPMGLSFGHRKLGGNTRAKGSGNNAIAVNLGRTIVLMDVEDISKQVELAFQTRYGRILDTQWFGEGQIAMSFSEGFLVVISTHEEELGEELYSAQFFKERITAMTYSKVLHRIAISGDGGIKIVNMSDFSEITDDSVKLEDVEENESNLMSYTVDGQILTVSTMGGVVQNFLSRMPSINDHYKTCVAYLSSLRELAVIDTISREKPTYVQVSIEPSFIALGAYHVAVGMNNHVWYYRIEQSGDTVVNEQEYLGTVSTVKLNDRYAVVLCEGKVYVHAIESQHDDRETKLFPEHDDGAVKIKTVALTKDFFIYGQQDGKLQYFYLKDWSMLNGSSYRHDEAIIQLYPNPQGTRVIFVDSRRQCFLYNAVTSHITHIPSVSNSVTRILWDPVDRGLFAAVEAQSFSLYMYSQLTINGEQVVELGVMTVESNGDFYISPQSTKLPYDYSPILLHDGELFCQEATGSINQVLAGTHDRLEITRPSKDKYKEAFCQNLSLLRLQEAWKLARQIELRQYWLALAAKAMELLDVEMAARVYRQLGDAGMVIALERLQYVEDRNLLAGEILILFGDYSKAQELLLTSSNPMVALQMQRDLLHWDQALKLASTLAPEQTAELSASYAQQLEFVGDNEQALQMYEQSCNFLESNPDVVPNKDELRHKCLSGIARSTLRLGDIRRGCRLVMEINDKQLCKECGIVLENMKQFPDAATLFEKGGHYDNAVAIYIQLKNFAKAVPLMKYVKIPKLHAQFARAKEASGDYEAAVKSYEIAQDIDSMVRILLSNLRNPEKAFAVVRQSKSSEGAIAVANSCKDSGNYSGAIEFLLMANKVEEAFELAQDHNEMDIFTQTLGDDISNEDSVKVAHHFEKQRNFSKAGQYYEICGNYHKALKLFLQCGDSEIDRAVGVVGKAQNDMLTHTLIDFLMGEADGVPKDPNYIFRLYMALGNYPQAAKTAIIIARQEQELGNYKVAHGVLFETFNKLQKNKIRVPQAVSRSLMLLHSYILVKKLVKQGDHKGAARMLVRVSKSISKFPSHVVNILTSTVIECQRANMKAQAYEYALMLMRPEYRSSIEAKFKRKIEALVRRPPKDEVEEDMSECPYCQTSLPVSELDCPNCKNWIAYCIVTGNHMSKDNWSMCPQCNFPALYNKFTTFLEAEEACPMCGDTVKASDIELLSEADIVLDPTQPDESPTDEEPQTD